MTPLRCPGVPATMLAAYYFSIHIDQFKLSCKQKIKTIPLKVVAREVSIVGTFLSSKISQYC